MTSAQRTHATVLCIGVILGSIATHFLGPWPLMVAVIAMLIPWPGQWSMLDNRGRDGNE